MTDINWDNMANWTVRDVELAADNAPVQFTAKLRRMATAQAETKELLHSHAFASVYELFDAYTYAKNEADMLMKTLEDMQKQKEATR